MKMFALTLSKCLSLRHLLRFNKAKYKFHDSHSAWKKGNVLQNDRKIEKSWTLLLSTYLCKLNLAESGYGRWENLWFSVKRGDYGAVRGVSGSQARKSPSGGSARAFSTSVLSSVSTVVSDCADPIDECLRITDTWFGRAKFTKQRFSWRDSDFDLSPKCAFSSNSRQFRKKHAKDIWAWWHLQGPEGGGGGGGSNSEGARRLCCHSYHSPLSLTGVSVPSARMMHAMSEHAGVGVLPFDGMGLYEQPRPPRLVFKMPRVVPDQKAKFESDELFRRLSRESEVSPSTDHLPTRTKARTEFLEEDPEQNLERKWMKTTWKWVKISTR